ncbi:hypothetical protein LPMP_250480 [Leishmania panamensis]|uniref:Kringle domain-containing protein n=1 Tax=Leishmania panamensis TaxID=5679 RepID=A0A088RSF8_LEIPA|nr:hypothetical protein LPMP_250480 [Leishmania panamensis]AIN98913.1 hypothetical protein LPMP_250480 [Leishmania panamensis]
MLRIHQRVMWASTPVASAVLVLAAVLVLFPGSTAAEPAYAPRATAAGSTCDSRTHVYYHPDGQDYRGTVNVTESGIPCQVWPWETPHSHMIPLDSATGVGSHNYCRNANGLERPSCFVATPGGGYQFCAIGGVCTERSFAKPTVQFWPVSGTQMAADGSSNYVTLSCYPRPCRIHYVLGAEALASATSPVYTQPILLEGSTTVKAYVMYETADPMRVQAWYTVIPATTAAPASSTRFIPSDAAAYHHPIFVELQGATNASHVLLYWNDDLVNPTTYTGGVFRPKTSTSIVAVVNSTHLVAASYKLNITAPPLQVFPPSGTYLGGVSVLVVDPQSPAMYYMYVNRSAEWESLDALLFPWTAIGTSEPSAYTVTCAYADDLKATHATAGILQWVAVPMQLPTFTPACGTNFPAIALSLKVGLSVSSLPRGGLATSWFVSASATGGARIPMITRSTDDEGVFVYDIFQSKSIQVPTTMEVYVTSRSLDPLEADSPQATCAYSLYPLDASATPYFSAIPDCATTSAPVSPSCVMALRLQLASCLHFYTTELLSIDCIGPIVLMRMTGLAAAIQSDMYTRMGACLADLQRRGVFSDVRNETSGEMVLAMSWHVATPTPMAAQVYRGLPTTVRITGFHAEAGAYHLVRSDDNCEDLGVLPETTLSRPSYATAAAGSSPVSPSSAGSIYLTFRVPFAGQYKLCSYISDSLYEVPFSSSEVGAAAPAVTQYLDVVVQPWPIVSATPAEERGGLVPYDMEGVPFALSMATTPAGAYASLACSSNSADWQSVPFPIDVTTKLGGAVSVSVGPLNHQTRPLEVLDASLVPASGAAQTSVFFVSAANPSMQRERITYLFYTVSASEVPAPLTGVMLLLQGQFQPDELIVIDVYENVSLTTAGDRASFSLQLLRRVTARPSAATAYTVALPDAVLGLPAGPQHIPYVVYATLDGAHVTTSPLTVALSPLALAMTSCTTCSSRLCYNEYCLCKNKRTKVVFICETDSGESGSNDSGDLPDGSGSKSSSSTSDSGDDNDIKPATMSQRLAFLFAYLGLLALIGGYILISMRRSSTRRERALHAQDISIESS